VEITLRDGQMEVVSPFVSVKGAIQVPLLRKVAELNFYPLCLAAIHMNEEKLFFHYKAPLDTCEPYKIYYVLKEICQTADTYDDDFANKFKTTNLVEPKVTFFSGEQVDKAWSQTNLIIQEVMQYADFFESKRWYGFALDFLNTGIKRISYCVQPQGFLKNELTRAIDETMDKNVNVLDRVKRARAFLQQLVQLGKESFAKSMYQAEVFVADKWNDSFEHVKKGMTDSQGYVRQAISEQNYIGACNEAYYFMYNHLQYNYVSKGVFDIVEGGLRNAAGKEWNEAATILADTMQSVISLN